MLAFRLLLLLPSVLCRPAICLPLFLFRCLFLFGVRQSESPFAHHNIIYGMRFPTPPDIEWSCLAPSDRLAKGPFVSKHCCYYVPFYIERSESYLILQRTDTLAAQMSIVFYSLFIFPAHNAHKEFTSRFVTSMTFRWYGLWCTVDV